VQLLKEKRIVIFVCTDMQWSPGCNIIVNFFKIVYRTAIFGEKKKKIVKYVFISGCKFQKKLWESFKEIINSV
jgi:hypothetical protein